MDVYVDDFVTAEYTIHIINGNNYQAQKALVMGVGTTAYVSEYGVMYEPNRIADISVSVAAGQIQVNLVPFNWNIWSYHLQIQCKQNALREVRNDFY